MAPNTRIAGGGGAAALPRGTQLLNLLLLLFACAPSVLFALHMRAGCPAAGEAPALRALRWACALALQQPLAGVNLLFLANVCVGFWVVSLLQGSTWVRLTWALLPLLWPLACMQRQGDCRHVRSRRVARSKQQRLPRLHTRVSVLHTPRARS